MNKSEINKLLKSTLGKKFKKYDYAIRDDGRIDILLNPDSLIEEKKAKKSGKSKSKKK